MDRQGDTQTIKAMQNEILAEIRKGKSFRTAHHEGGSIIFHEDGRFKQSGYGEEEFLKVFDDEKDFLDFVRNFYDWESRRDTYPTRPPEIDVWKYILGQLWPMKNAEVSRAARR